MVNADDRPPEAFGDAAEITELTVDGLTPICGNANVQGDTLG